MAPSEVEVLVGELETRVDRLRALYEQYFMGIERLEPTVARKDVDRRFYTLRKMPMRNTALRFRFQMLLQRYTTFQTQWARVCRQIEDGTYKRQIGRRVVAKPSLDADLIPVEEDTLLPLGGEPYEEDEKTPVRVSRVPSAPSVPAKQAPPPLPPKAKAGKPPPLPPRKN